MDTKNLLEASYKNQAAAAEQMRKLGYTYDKGLSTNESKVFVDPMGKPHITFRGSKRLSDYVVDDALIGLGLPQYSRRVNEAKAVTSAVEKKYGKPADTFGWSLGGYLAENAGNRGNITTYNKLAAPADIGRTIPHRQTDIRVASDLPSLVSLSQKYRGNIKTLPARAGLYTSHDLSNLKYL